MGNFNFQEAMEATGIETHFIDICPRCKEMKDMTYPALSRKDNKTDICSDCGTAEAMEAFAGREK